MKRSEEKSPDEQRASRIGIGTGPGEVSKSLDTKPILEPQNCTEGAPRKIHPLRNALENLNGGNSSKVRVVNGGEGARITSYFNRINCGESKGQGQVQTDAYDLNIKSINATQTQKDAISRILLYQNRLQVEQEL